MATLAQAAHACRIVWVQSGFDELDAFERPMVGDGTGGAAQAMVPAASVGSVTWADASRIPRQHTGTCEPMGFRGVWIAAARAALVLGFPALVAQGAGGDQVRAAGGGAYLVHRIPPLVEKVRHVGVPAPRKLPRKPLPDSPFSSTSGEPPHGCGADEPWWPVLLVDHAGHG